MKQYLELIEDIYKNGNQKGDRTGTGTKSLFGHQMRFNLQDGFPLLTNKFTSMRLIASELLWFLRGETNIKSLVDDDNHIWDEWADENGDLGPVYGYQWRSWDGGWCKIDQIKVLIDQIKNNPNSRRMIVSAWNVCDLPDESVSPQDNVENGQMALAPCHTFFQCYVHDGKLSLHLYQRSTDTFLGLPFNIASYALLTHMLAQVCDLDVGEFVWSGGDNHIYNNHFAQVEELLERDSYPLPELELNSEIKDINDFTLDDINIIGYHHRGSIKAPISV